MNSLSISAPLPHYDEEYAKALQEYLNPRSRPRHISPKRRVKWRLLKKWFNRYEKQNYIGATVFFVHADGTRIPCAITNVQIEKAGKHRINYCITSVPVTLCDIF